MSFICIFKQNLPSIFFQKILQLINFHLFKIKQLLFEINFVKLLPDSSTLSAYLYKKCTAEKGCEIDCKQ